MEVAQPAARQCALVVSRGASRERSTTDSAGALFGGAERRADERRRFGDPGGDSGAAACAGVNSGALGLAGWLGNIKLSHPVDCKTEPADHSEPPQPPSPLFVPGATSAVCAARPPFLPPCRVCSCPASGFHYGVNTCEACKGFFHRSLQRKVPYQCSKAGVCDVRQSERNSCAACRYQRCLRAGMAKEGVKTGRYTHQKRTCDTLEIKRIQSILSVHGSEAAQSASIISRLEAAFTECFQGTAIFYTNPGKVEALKKNLLLRHGTKSVDRILHGDSRGGGGAEERRGEAAPAKPRDAGPVLGAARHCADGAAAAAAASSAVQHGDLSAREMYELWNSEMESLIRAIVRFAKSVPGYSRLPLQDQIALIKASRAELMFLVKYKVCDPALKCLADFRNGCITLMPGRYLKLLWQDSDYAAMCMRNAKRLQSFALSAADVALLMAVALLSPDRDGLTEAPAVQAAQEALLPALRRSISASHPHELSVHAEALLLLAQLRELSDKNSRVLADLYQRSPAGFVPLIMECLPQRVFPYATLRQKREFDES